MEYGTKVTIKYPREFRGQLGKVVSEAVVCGDFTLQDVRVLGSETTLALQPDVEFAVHEALCLIRLDHQAGQGTKGQDHALRQDGRSGRGRTW